MKGSSAKLVPLAPQSSGATGKVGFFWIVSDRLGRDAILGEAIEVANAETYGDFLTHPGGHYDFWEQMKLRGPAWLRPRNLSALLLSTEYEDWPRGRVVFSLVTKHPTIFADRRILTQPSRLQKVCMMFQIVESHFDRRTDTHYR
ncbi:MAG: hypothetical protein EOS34_28020 [Mesorhizobium sp.]|nr:MAG: hypothetical protein EOS34_28020 [Mesorhizobium sp.]